MSEDDTKDALRDLGARVFALQAGLMAVMRTHPNPVALSDLLTKMEDAGLANMLYVWDDSHVDVYRSAVRQIRDQIPQK